MYIVLVVRVVRWAKSSIGRRTLAHLCLLLLLVSVLEVLVLVVREVGWGKSSIGKRDISTPVFTGTAHVSPPNTHIIHFMIHCNRIFKLYCNRNYHNSIFRSFEKTHLYACIFVHADI